MEETSVSHRLKIPSQWRNIESELGFAGGNWGRTRGFGPRHPGKSIPTLKEFTKKYLENLAN